MCADLLHAGEIDSCTSVSPDERSSINDEDSTVTPSERHAAKVIDLKSLKRSRRDLNSTGLVYMSRVPPYMPPHQVKYLLSKYGEIGRIYLTPEPIIHANRRRKYKRDRRVKYTEGWIEFMNKKVAKKVCEHLNGFPINVKRSSHYRDDLWNLKYLPRFKWINLTEQIVYEQRMKRQRLRAEISKAAKENASYIKNVEDSKIISAIEGRRSRKEDGPKSSPNAIQGIRRVFKQRSLKTEVSEDLGNMESEEPLIMSSSIMRSFLC